MSNAIGEVNINLRMSLAQFKQDTRQGSNEASRAGKQIADEMKASSHEAKAALALIGEEIGVTIPRHIRGFIAAVPGVGAALNAAFDSIAVIALLGVLVEVIHKVSELGEESEKTAKEWEKFNDQVDGFLNKGDTLGSTIGTIGDKLTDLNSKEANSSTLWKGLGQALEDINTLPTVHYVTSLFDVFSKGDPTLKKITATTADFYESLKKVERTEGTKAALALITEKLNEMYASSERGNPFLERTIEKLEQTQTIVANGVNDEFNKEIKKAAEEAQKAIDAEWESYTRLQKIVKQSSVSKLSDRFQTQDDLKRTGYFNETAPTVTFPGQQLKDIIAVSPQLPKYIGANKELVKVQTDQTEAIKEADKIYESTRTSAEQYREEIAVLNELLKQGKIDQETYNRAMVQAKQRYSDTYKALQQFGATVGDDIKQAALYGKSWSDAFGAIAIDLAQLILKMTLLKSLQSSTGAGAVSGIGGFFSSLLSGFGGGKAAGGFVQQGTGYVVGEHGPEYFVPKTSGSIIPNMSVGSGDGGQQVTHNEFNFHGVTDADSFRKSKSQIAAEMASLLGRHSRRNG
jgi:uncharacterized protein YoxC